LKGYFGSDVIVIGVIREIVSIQGKALLLLFVLVPFRNCHLNVICLKVFRFGRGS
jgi:hypothetical protein